MVPKRALLARQASATEYQQPSSFCQASCFCSGSRSYLRAGSVVQGLYVQSEDSGTSPLLPAVARQHQVTAMKTTASPRVLRRYILSLSCQGSLLSIPPPSVKKGGKRRDSSTSKSEHTILHHSLAPACMWLKPETCNTPECTTATHRYQPCCTGRARAVCSATKYE